MTRSCLLWLAGCAMSIPLAAQTQYPCEPNAAVREQLNRLTNLSDFRVPLADRLQPFARFAEEPSARSISGAALPRCTVPRPAGNLPSTYTTLRSIPTAPTRMIPCTATSKPVSRERLTAPRPRRSRPLSRPPLASRGPTSGSRNSPKRRTLGYGQSGAAPPRVPGGLPGESARLCHAANRRRSGDDSMAPRNCEAFSNPGLTPCPCRTGAISGIWNFAPRPKVRPGGSAPAHSGGCGGAAQAAAHAYA